VVDEQETVAQDATKKRAHHRTPYDIDAGLGFDGATEYGEALFEIVRAEIVEARRCRGVSFDSLGYQAIAPDTGSAESAISEVEYAR